MSKFTAVKNHRILHGRVIVMELNAMLILFDGHDKVFSKEIHLSLIQNALNSTKKNVFDKYVTLKFVKNKVKIFSGDTNPITDINRFQNFERVVRYI